MKIFTSSQYQLAANFIVTNARPLEKALYLFEFADGNREDVIRELQKFQNDDGGFGHGLEPDFRTENSSALASSVAMQILSKIGAEDHLEIVQNAIRYFINSYDKNTYGWEKVPKAVEEAPRAPWWNYQEPREDWGNPNAEILGYFYDYQPLVPASLLAELTEYAIRYFNRLETFEFHEILSFLRLADRLPESIYQQIEEKIIQALHECVTTDSQKWEEYCLQPIQVVDSPESKYYRLFKAFLSENLHYISTKQNPNGSWSPTWSWFGQFEDTWKQAKLEWEGNITLQHLLLFRNFALI
ncbi:hypothetical protein OEV98_14520 [Caldibacillus lycopersici]|uniref:Prenyltransferase n=1 Tax=Perspicuibacillus lycopersici TaxID=1325689 RepID=A0AAE3LNI6_9BACI|nr:hypothetical protein [Perspicuibacillus lycopersici]MCU9614755.1 hypothetical protein [Perspicuibacillus lycopersici]